VAAVAREDLAAVASAVLTSAPPAPGSAHAALDVTGPDLLTWQDIADAVAARTGRPVRYQEIGSEDFAARLRAAGRPEDLVEGMTGLFADIRAGHLAVRSDVVRRLSGRDALSFTRSVAGPP
jgi:NAD(P)H dehydrogenase (quinone)